MKGTPCFGQDPKWGGTFASGAKIEGTQKAEQLCWNEKPSSVILVKLLCVRKSKTYHLQWLIRITIREQTIPLTIQAYHFKIAVNTVQQHIFDSILLL